MLENKTGQDVIYRKSLDFFQEYEVFSGHELRAFIDILLLIKLPEWTDNCVAISLKNGRVLV